MLKCIAIDDEPKALEVIARYARNTPLLLLLESFREPLKALEYIGTHEVHLIFLDIQMPDINGLQLLSTMPEQPMVIFTTAFSEYAIESYAFRAIDYLLKPVTFERFLTSVNKAYEIFRLKNKNPAPSEFVLIKSGPQTHKIKLRDILYLEKNGNYLTVYTKEKKVLVRENMTEVFAIIPREGFVRVHKSYIVAINHISSFESHQLTIGHTIIPIGIMYRNALRKQLGL